jgi:hypothetical protein
VVGMIGSLALGGGDLAAEVISSKAATMSSQVSGPRGARAAAYPSSPNRSETGAGS